MCLYATATGTGERRTIPTFASVGSRLGAVAAATLLSVTSLEEPAERRSTTTTEEHRRARGRSRHGAEIQKKEGKW